ncbi:unnamed protein product, partial [Rotaria socialis]
MSNASKFLITGSRDGGVPSSILKPSAVSSHPVYIQIRINNQPTKAIVDTGSAISIIHIEFLKNIKHENFRRQTQQRWINTNHIHLFGDQQQLTIPDQYGQRITISYVEPPFINQPALLVNQITLPPYSQTLVDITCRIYNDKDLIFEPQPNHLSNCILIPHTLLSIRNHQAKPNRKNICDRCNEYFLSGNDLQKHLRTACYSDQIRKHIVESTKHIDNEKHRLAIQDILWRNKILFDPTPSIINISSQTAIKTGDHPPIYSKQYSSSYEDQEIKVQETQKLLERGQIEESTSTWSSPIVLVKKKDKTLRFCIDYRRLNAITIKNAFPLPRIEEIFDQLSDAVYYTKFDFKSGYSQ